VTGEHRQVNIRALTPGHPLVLIRNHDNPNDKHAIIAFTEAGKDVGYLPAHFADRIARVLDARQAVTAVVDDVEEFESSGAIGS
jgi:outer membrane receptor for ferrienterochelin and colicin